MSAAPPLIGPGERDRAAGPLFEGGADVHRGDVGLPRFAFADAVGARFREQQRLVTRHVLKPREVGAQLRLAVQVDIERADIEEGEIEKFGRREVDVCEETSGRCVFRGVVEIAQKILDADATVPSNDARRDLVAERKRQHRWMG